MTLVWRVCIGMAWTLMIALLAAAVLTALFPEPCVDDGVVTSRDCDPGAINGLTIEGSR